MSTEIEHIGKIDWDYLNALYDSIKVPEVNAKYRIPSELEIISKSSAVYLHEIRRELEVRFDKPFDSVRWITHMDVHTEQVMHPKSGMKMNVPAASIVIAREEAVVGECSALKNASRLFEAFASGKAIPVRRQVRFPDFLSFGPHGSRRVKSVRHRGLVHTSKEWNDQEKVITSVLPPVLVWSGDGEEDDLPIAIIGALFSKHLKAVGCGNRPNRSFFEDSQLPYVLYKTSSDRAVVDFSTSL